MPDEFKEYIADVCKLLGIEMPGISYSTAGFATKTTLAQCDLLTRVIYLDKKADKQNPDCLFCIAHELRHIYQYQTDKQYYFSNYRQSDKCLSVEEYNLQIAEVDANAFASIIMTDFFSIKPLWNGLSDKVIRAIHERIKFLLTNEFFSET